MVSPAGPAPLRIRNTSLFVFSICYLAGTPVVVGTVVLLVGLALGAGSTFVGVVTVGAGGWALVGALTAVSSWRWGVLLSADVDGVRIPPHRFAEPVLVPWSEITRVEVAPVPACRSGVASGEVALFVGVVAGATAPREVFDRLIADIGRNVRDRPDSRRLFATMRDELVARQREWSRDAQPRAFHIQLPARDVPQARLRAAMRVWAPDASLDVLDAPVPAPSTPHLSALLLAQSEPMRPPRLPGD